MTTQYRWTTGGGTATPRPLDDTAAIGDLLALLAAVSAESREDLARWVTALDDRAPRAKKNGKWGQPREWSGGGWYDVGSAAGMPRERMRVAVRHLSGGQWRTRVDAGTLLCP